VVALVKYTLLEGSRTNAESKRTCTGCEQVAKSLVVEHKRGRGQGGVTVGDTAQSDTPF